ncbi:hypothetical protein [Micromonospora sp. NBC_00858]|uniref:hypothetical protein n=1 Tax=Micromonospora sp. NBC_00858 TaxID=2975979 RepID=UPI0038701943|nr:hypothetical protein OG990_27600 [Micromonospora sp. NBC_00858]
MAWRPGGVAAAWRPGGVAAAWRRGGVAAAWRPGGAAAVWRGAYGDRPEGDVVGARDVETRRGDGVLAPA